MSTVIKEQWIRFEFGDAWQALKYDDHKYYRESIEKLKGSFVGPDGREHHIGTRGVDIIGLYREERPVQPGTERKKTQETLYFIEVKDFRAQGVEKCRRPGDDQFALEVGIKIRDTIAGMVAAFHRYGETSDWDAFISHLLCRPGRIRVVLWLEEDGDAELRRRRGHPWPTLIDRLRNRMAWLTKRVFICDHQTNELPDLKVTLQRKESKRSNEPS